ncbi:DJ-1/PfpI family protein [Paenibacillus sp. NEAU-GSW1]|uniref:DJ-1/PfpI family protein n=1 Tax=Paenibacillus sp. NEAU-GSW1 TaxID=2682486 RepID=UPI0012E306A7|nr:DJ-1/PfpI family protein [Paenibacillus sp. NEAU-GSW1]MUT67193.1 DJ-1/PfpI family protein [Paenibacillus sp. NEAU-GSW1]
MKIAFVLFNGVTFLDFVGFYDVITRLKYFESTKDVTWDICGMQEEVTDELGMTIKMNKIKPDLSLYDIVFVPGGLGTRQLRFNQEFVIWLHGASNARYIVSVCTGSLLLGAAGFLQNVKATTHPFTYELLEPYTREVVHSRIVHDGKIITAGGVATSIDLGLYLIGIFINENEVENIKKQMDYPYHPAEILVV